MLAGFHFFVASSWALALSNDEKISFLVGIISHHLLDRLPHLDLNVLRNSKFDLRKNFSFKLWLIISLEFLFFIFLSFYFIGKLELGLQRIAFWGGIGGVFPDIISFFQKKFFPQLIFLEAYSRFHRNFHFKSLKNFYFPFLVQFLIFILSLIFYLGLI